MCTPRRALLAEDDPLLASLMQALMRAQGYECDGVADAHEAVERLLAGTTRYDLLVTDWSLPNGGGEYVLDGASRMTYPCPVLVCSGTPFDLELAPAALQGRIQFLQKPFLPRDLFAVLTGFSKRD